MSARHTLETAPGREPGRRFLIVRMGAMGDIIHALPVAATLRRAYPAAEIDWLVEEKWLPLLAGNPHLNRVFPIRSREASSVWTTVAAMRRRRYHTVLDLQGLLKSASLARFSGAREVVGFETSNLREKLARVFYGRTVPVEGHHVVEFNLALARAAGARDAVLEFPLRGSNAPAGPEAEFVAISPSAGWPAKCWPEASYAALIGRISGELGLAVAVNCGPGEEALARRIEVLTKPAAIAIAGGSIPELVSLARRARAFIAGDTGPLHVAAAVGTPVVAIFGPTSPERNGPFSQSARTVRPPGVETTYQRSASGEAIARVTVDEVFAALQSVLRPA